MLIPRVDEKVILISDFTDYGPDTYKHVSTTNIPETSYSHLSVASLGGVYISTHLSTTVQKVNCNKK